MVRFPDTKSDCYCRGKAQVRILNSKTTWSEFHHLPRVGPKQLCASAHLGCTRVAGTSQLASNAFSPSIFHPKWSNFCWLKDKVQKNMKNIKQAKLKSQVAKIKDFDCCLALFLLLQNQKSYNIEILQSILNINHFEGCQQNTTSSKKTSL